MSECDRFSDSMLVNFRTQTPPTTLLLVNPRRMYLRGVSIPIKRCAKHCQFSTLCCISCCWVAEGGMLTSDHWWDERWKREERVDERWSVPAGATRERALAGMKIKGKGVKFDLQGGHDRELWKTLQKLGYLEGVSSTYPPEPDLLDVWNIQQLRGGPPCVRWHGSQGMWRHLPSLLSDCRSWAVSSIRNEAGRGHIHKTGAASIRLDPLVGGQPTVPCGHLRLDDLPNHPASQEASG